MLKKFRQRVRDINRLRNIINVLIQQGFGLMLHQIKLVPSKKDSKPKVPHEVRLRLTLEQLGPTFVKFGQILSLRPDLIPKQYVQELGKLHDSVPPFPYKDVKNIIEQELHKPIDKIFSSFDETPIASASIAQVHKAVLKDGQEVAVKIQRPRIKEKMEADIEIM